MLSGDRMNIISHTIASVEPSKNPLLVDPTSPVYALCEGLSLQVTTKGWKREVSFILHDRLTGERVSCSVELAEVKSTSFFKLPKKDESTGGIRVGEVNTAMSSNGTGKSMFNLPVKGSIGGTGEKEKFKFNLPK